MRKALCSFLLLAAACGSDAADGTPALHQETDGGAPQASSATLVPHASWTCGLPDGIPVPRAGTPAFTAELDVLETHALGETQYGTRTLRRFGAGTFAGTTLTATLTAGGFEQDLKLANGAAELEEVLVLRGQNESYVYLRVCGVAAASGDAVRVVLDFEAANDGPHAALNGAKLVGERRLSDDGKKVVLEVFDVSALTPTEPRVTVTNPDGVPNQSWDCVTHNDEQGDELWREVVGIGGSQAVGTTKRGNRNIIPITGGTSNAPVAGTILAMGADYQILSGGYNLDARYAVKAEDGELLLIRNCGSLPTLIPSFETRKDGKLAYLNEGKYRSAIPIPGAGVVNITIYRTK